MSTHVRSAVIRLAECRSAIPTPAGERSILALGRGTLDVKLAHPELPNLQTPHTQDELYVVTRGTGTLVHDGTRDAFATGDMMFVAAGVEHCFEDCSADFEIWRIFYGQEGGEVAANPDAGPDPDVGAGTAH